MIEQVVPLFDAYRQFYDQRTDLEGARKFLADRLTNNESTILVASEGESPLGFAQLYPSFSSTSMKRIWILNDLWVLHSARKRGVASALLHECKRFATETGATELLLETKKTNLTAQRLYESHGWKRDELFYRYSLSI
jgi:ribosomal protein S18 acetylase RimI-like enzyme